MNTDLYDYVEKNYKSVYDEISDAYVENLIETNEKNEIIDEKHEARLKQYSRMVASGYIAAPPPLFDSKPEDRFYPVRNSHFNKWRNLNRLGGDLLIFSSLKEYRCDPPIEVVLK